MFLFVDIYLARVLLVGGVVSNSIGDNRPQHTHTQLDNRQLIGRSKSRYVKLEKNRERRINNLV